VSGPARSVAEDAVHALAGEDGLLDHVSFRSPSKMRPPIEEYSPSLFSRTTQKSMSPGFRFAQRRRNALHQRTGGCWRTGGTPADGMSRPQSDTWSGTPGKPTAPRKMAS